MTTKKQVQLVALLGKKYFVARNISDQDMRDTLIAGLTWQTHCWVDLALEWIEQGFELDSGIVEILEQVSENKVFPQKTRHKAFQYARRWRKASNT